MTLSENKSLGLKSESKSLKNDKEMENKDNNSGLGEGKSEKKRFVIVLKKMGSLSKGSPASNNYIVQVNEKTSDISTSDKVTSNPLLTQALEKTCSISSKVNSSPLLTQALEKSPTIISRVKNPLSPKFVDPLSPPISLFYPSVLLEDKPEFPTLIDECLQIDQTSTEEGTQTSAIDENTSPKLSTSTTKTDESALRSSADLPAFLYQENELTSAACNLTNTQTQHLKDHGVPELPVILMKPMTALLKFTLDFDHFPTSPSMIRLAKMMKMPWSQVKEWFSYKRQEKRKNGFHLHNKILKYCPYCQNQLPFTDKDLGQQHLYEEDHINQLLQIEHQNSENSSGQRKTSATLDDVIMKALGFTSVGGQPSIPQQNVGAAAGSLNDNRVKNKLAQKYVGEKVAQTASGKKKNTGLRKEIPTPEEYTLLIKPLQQGWIREVVYRATVGEKVSKSFDVYYKPPVGKKCRSKPNIEKYFEQNGMGDLTLDNFDYSYKQLGENVKNEFIRYATASQKPPTFRNQQQTEKDYLILTPAKSPSKKNLAVTFTQGISSQSIKPTPTKSTNVIEKFDGAMVAKVIAEAKSSNNEAAVAKIIAEANSSKFVSYNKNYCVIAKKGTPLHIKGNNGIENESGNMSGLKSWHTPSSDKPDMEQNIPSSIIASWISPPIEQPDPDEGDNTSAVSLHSKGQNAKTELDNHDGISSAILDKHTQISLKNDASDRPKIRIKSMLDLFGSQEKVINDSTVPGSESSIDSCNRNESLAQESSDSAPKNIEINGKRKRTDDNLIANKKEKMAHEISSDKNSDIAEIPAIHTDSDLNDNESDIVEISNDNIRNNYIVTLSDAESENEDNNCEETDPLA